MFPSEWEVSTTNSRCTGSAVEALDKHSRKTRRATMVRHFQSGHISCSTPYGYTSSRFSIAGIDLRELSTKRNEESSWIISVVFKATLEVPKGLELPGSAYDNTPK
jgi:hypothetical protein